MLYTVFFFFNDTATTEIYTLSLHDALPILERASKVVQTAEGVEKEIVTMREAMEKAREAAVQRSEEHTSELQSH